MKSVPAVGCLGLKMNRRRRKKEIGFSDDSFQLFAYEGRSESTEAIDISGSREVLFLFVYLICGRSFSATEEKEPVEGRE